MAALYSLGDHRLLFNYSEKLRVNLVCSKAPQEDHLLEARGKQHTHGFGPQATLCFITAFGSIPFAIMVTLQFWKIIPVSLSWQPRCWKKCSGEDMGVGRTGQSTLFLMKVSLSVCSPSPKGVLYSLEKEWETPVCCRDWKATNTLPTPRERNERAAVVGNPFWPSPTEKCGPTGIGEISKPICFKQFKRPKTD